jgi:hypothetical protein
LAFGATLSSSFVTRMEEKSDFIALYFCICALQMHISLILVANEDYYPYGRCLTDHQ